MENAINNPASKEKTRESGIELFRIIAMILVVAHHYVVNSGITVQAYNNPLSLPSIFLFIFGGWGKTAINCFVLITGYFMCESKISAKKFFKLIFEVMFYNIIIACIFFLTGYEEITISGVIKAILPFTAVATNFTGCFLLFFLTIPFLNMLTKVMTKRQHLLLTAFLIFVYVVLGSIPVFDVKMNYLTWYIVLYFIASYIKLHPGKLSENRKFWGIASIVSILVAIASIIAGAWLGPKIDRNLIFYFVADSNKILAVIVAVCTFMYFKNLKFKSRFINAVASTCFGVLLIHAHGAAMRRFLYGDVLNVTQMYGSGMLVVHAIISVIAIFVVCAIIDYARQKLIEKPLFKKLDGKFSRIDDFFARKNTNKEKE